MYALTAVLISIGGIDKGTAYKTVAKQLYEMRKADDECFESVWRRFESQSTVDGKRQNSEGMEATLVERDVERWPDDPCHLLPQACA